MAHPSNYQYKALLGKRIVERSLERRRAVRYELHIPVVFFWENAEGSKIQTGGVTRDISDIGLYVFSEKCPPLKSKVRVEVMLAQAGIANASLKGSMQVLRVEDGPEGFGGCGFALAGKTLSLSDAAQA